MKVKIIGNGHVPTIATKGSAGLDIYSCEDAAIMPHSSEVVCTGLMVEIPEGKCGLLCNRSGLNFKHDITLHGVSVIDSDYRGEVKVKLYNDSNEPYYVGIGERVCQMVIVDYLAPSFEVVDSLDSSTERGDGGFGHSGK